jgi:hypothetical protein
VRVGIAEALAVQLGDYALTNEVARQAACVEERACLNVTLTVRSWRRSLAAPRLIKKYRDEKVIVRES